MKRLCLVLSLLVWGLEAETAQESKEGESLSPLPVDEEKLKVRDPLPVPTRKLYIKSVQKQVYKKQLESNVEE